MRIKLLSDESHNNYIQDWNHSVVITLHLVSRFVYWTYDSNISLLRQLSSLHIHPLNKWISLNTILPPPQLNRGFWVLTCCPVIFNFLMAAEGLRATSTEVRNYLTHYLVSHLLPIQLQDVTAVVACFLAFTLNGSSALRAILYRHQLCQLFIVWISIHVLINKKIIFTHLDRRLYTSVHKIYNTTVRCWTSICT
jgi:hypothetical protein